MHTAHPSDLPLLLLLIEEYYASDGLEFGRDTISAGLEQLLAHPEYGQAFLIYDEEAIVGYTILTYAFDLEFGGRQAFVTDLFLRAEYRGQGLGTKTMHNLERFARERGLKSLELQVEMHNQAARAFYQKLGFRTHNRIPLSKML